MHELTVIGLPAKKQKKASEIHAKPKLQPFLKLHTSIKKRSVTDCMCVCSQFQCLFFHCSHAEMVC